MLAISSCLKTPLEQCTRQIQGHFWAHKQKTDHMLEAHKRVHTRLHELAQKEGKKIEVGLTHQALRFIPSSRWNYLARIVSFVMTYLFHEQFLEFAKNNEKFIDRLGIQYYTRPLIGGCIPDSTHHEGEKMIKSMKFRFHPQGILPIIEEISKALPNTPLIITETGMAGENTISPKTPKEHKTNEKRKSYYETIFKAVYIAQKTLKEKLNGFLF